MTGSEFSFGIEEEKQQQFETFPSAAAALCEEASSGSVWKQDVGRRTGHLPHAMEPLELICIGYVVCVCVF